MVRNVCFSFFFLCVCVCVCSPAFSFTIKYDISSHDSRSGGVVKDRVDMGVVSFSILGFAGEI
jgi:hypothetical protein